jgi:hypothetical protein
MVSQKLAKEVMKGISLTTKAQRHKARSEVRLDSFAVLSWGHFLPGKLRGHLWQAH